MGKELFTDLTEDEVAYYYSLLTEEVTNYDCGSLCKDDNNGVPFCCVTEKNPKLTKKYLLQRIVRDNSVAVYWSH